MSPGEKRQDGFGNSFVFERRDRDLVYVWNQQDKLIAVKFVDWDSWTVTVKAQQEGFAL